LADPAQALGGAIFITSMTGLGILGARWIINDALYKEYCRCTHEFNQHWIRPRGIHLPEGWPETEKCKRCGCKMYQKQS
jgi:hypothetical protein